MGHLKFQFINYFLTNVDLTSETECCFYLFDVFFYFTIRKKILWIVQATFEPAIVLVSYTIGRVMNLPHSEEFEILLTRSKMACSDMITCTAKQCFSTLWLPGDSGPDSSPVARVDDNN